MLWSLLNSVKGKSALHPAAAASDLPFIPARPPSPPIIAPHAPLTQELAPSTVIRPDRCCVYCGHALFAAPRVPKVRCPRCSREIPVRDVSIAQDICQERILTAGRIIVAADARVEAELVACHIDIAGRVLGNVLASHCCRLRSTAKLAGDIICRHLQIDPGAILEGQVELVKTQN